VFLSPPPSVAPEILVAPSASSTIQILGDAKAVTLTTKQSWKAGLSTSGHSGTPDGVFVSSSSFGTTRRGPLFLYNAEHVVVDTETTSHAMAGHKSKLIVALLPVRIFVTTYDGHKSELIIVNRFVKPIPFWRVCLVQTAVWPASILR
jgi:hypothetical protein